MSSCDLSDHARRFQASVGWDPERQTYWCCVVDYNNRHPHEDVYPFIEHGYKDDDVYPAPGPLLDIVAPYAISFHRPMVTMMLELDRIMDSERRYYFTSDQPEVPNFIRDR